jgi:hypothetical protein
LSGFAAGNKTGGVLDYLSIGFDIRGGQARVLIPPQWLDTHSRGLKELLGQCQRTRHNEKRDLLVFNDVETGAQVYRTLLARKQNEVRSKARQRLLRKGGKHSRAEIAKLWEIQARSGYRKRHQVPSTKEMAGGLDSRQRVGNPVPATLE